MEPAYAAARLGILCTQKSVALKADIDECRRQIRAQRDNTAKNYVANPSSRAGSQYA
jgi:hypothetical protein